MEQAPTLGGPPKPGDTAVPTVPKLTSHREEEQGRADARGAAVEPLLLVPDAPDHHAQTLGDREKPHKEIPHRCSAHSALPALGATPLTGTKRTQPTSVPVNADFTTSA